MTSIRGYLVTLIIALITLVSFLAALQSYQQSTAQAQQLFDDELKVLAASVLAPYRPELAVTATAQTHAVQLFKDQQLLYRSALAPVTPLAQQAGFSEQNFGGKRWMTYQLLQPPYRVLVAQPLSDRLQLSDQVVLASIYPVVLSLPLQALLIWWIVSKGLTPLREFARQLSQKKSADLSPVVLQETPAELATLLQTTNQLLQQLQQAFAREQRFAADVAHELRTPLAVLQANLHNAAQLWQQAALPDPHQLMPALQQGVVRMSGLIEQILLLNRTAPEQFAQKRQPIELTGFTREIIAELYPQISQKQQQIEMFAPDALQLQTEPVSLRLLLLNLLGNAIKYTPPGGQIRVQLQQAEQHLLWLLDDSGPGIAETELDKVFERFYRVGGDRHQSGQPGSGLGLAIAQEITQLHQGHLTLSRSELGGLAVRLELPLC